jgi:hypothetical protein
VSTRAAVYILTIHRPGNLKGTMSQDFRTSDFFINQSTLGPWSRAKAVLHMATNLPRNLRYSFENFSFRGFNETAKADSGVSMRTQKRIWQFQWDSGSGFGNFIETAAAASAFSMKPHNSFFLRKVVFNTKLHLQKFGFCSLNEIAKADSAV